MKWTASSIVVALGTAMIFYAFWPEAAWRGSIPLQVVAQENRGAPQKQSPRPRPEKPAEARVEKHQEAEPVQNEIVKKLRQRMNAEFSDVPFQDVVDSLRERLDVNFVIDKKSLEEEGIGTDKSVLCTLKDVRVETVLDLVLEELELVWVVRDEYLLITTPAKLDSLLEVHVYNCRDLIQPDMHGKLSDMSSGGMMGGMGMSGMGMPGMGMPGMVGGGMPGAGMAMGMAGMPGMPGMEGAGEMGMMSGMSGGAPGMSGVGMGQGGGPAPPDTQSLIEVITTAVLPETWTDAGGVGSISPYRGGLIVVNHHSSAHQRIERLLAMMREASKEKPGSVVRGR